MTINKEQLLIEKVKIKEALLMDKCRSDFYTFMRYTFPNKDVKWNWHHKYVCGLLQEFVLGDIDKLMIFMPPQHQKSLQSDTPVLTTKGWKVHSDLNVGEYVYNDKGNPVKILAVNKTTSHPCMKLTFDNGETIIAGEEHLWKVYCDRGKKTQVKGSRDKSKAGYSYKRVSVGREIEVLQTQDIFNGYHKRMPAIKITEPLKLKKASLPIDPYLLGVWLGDGTSASGRITCGSEDIEHFKSAMNCSLRIKKNKAPKTTYTVSIEGLHTKLRENGLLNNKHIPEAYLVASIEQRKELIRGLLDTDGSASKRGRISITQKNKNIAEGIYRILQSLGVKPSFRVEESRLYEKKCGDVYVVAFSPNKGDYYFKLKRKQKRINDKTQKDRSDKTYLFIEKVEKVGNHSAKCIQVEGKIYLAGRSFIPTHNSTMMTEYLPAWLFGVNPNAEALLIMYNATMAAKYNRKIQRIMDNPLYRDIFPETRLNEKNIVNSAKGSYVRNSEEFQIVGHRGFLKATGVGGGIAGNPAKFTFMDDVIKNVAEASSQTYRDKIYEWQTDELEARQHNDSKIAFTITRRHEDDLAGRLIERDGLIEEGGVWKVVILPALKENNNNPNDIREIGEALFPHLHSQSRMENIRRLNPRTFASLYQQRPAPTEGNMVKGDWFQKYDLSQILARIKSGECVPHFYIDTALSEKEQKRNDPSGILIWTVYKNMLFLLHYHGERLGFPDLIEKIIELHDEWGVNRQTKIFIENKANGASVKQQLIRTTEISVILENIKGDKVQRLEVETPSIESGRVLIPQYAKWIPSWIQSVITFPNGTHDEEIDTLTGAIRMAFKKQTRKRQKTKVS